MTDDCGSQVRWEVSSGSQGLQYQGLQYQGLQHQSRVWTHRLFLFYFFPNFRITINSWKRWNKTDWIIQCQKVLIDLRQSNFDDIQTSGWTSLCINDSDTPSSAEWHIQWDASKLQSPPLVDSVGFPCTLFHVLLHLCVYSFHNKTALKLLQLPVVHSVINLCVVPCISAVVAASGCSLCCSPPPESSVREPLLKLAVLWSLFT